MDGTTVYTIVANTGFAIGIATYLVKWMVGTFNAKLEQIVDLQYKIVTLQEQILKTQQMIIKILSQKEKVEVIE